MRPMNIEQRIADGIHVALKMNDPEYVASYEEASNYGLVRYLEEMLDEASDEHKKDICEYIRYIVSSRNIPFIG